MRRIERIPIILQYLNKESFEKLLDFLYFLKGNDKQTNLTYNIKKIETIEKFFKERKEIEEYWLKNPDLRFQQVLINKNIIGNYFGNWYYLEDEDLFSSAKIIELPDILLWGQRLDKDGNELEETVFRPIRTLETEHIEKILNTQRITPFYRKVFEEELKERNSKTKVKNKYICYFTRVYEVDADTVEEATNIAWEEFSADEEVGFTSPNEYNFSLKVLPCN